LAAHCDDLLFAGWAWSTTPAHWQFAMPWQLL
jgi:hypothetical protein